MYIYNTTLTINERQKNRWNSDLGTMHECISSHVHSTARLIRGKQHCTRESFSVLYLCCERFLGWWTPREDFPGCQGVQSTCTFEQKLNNQQLWQETWKREKESIWTKNIRDVEHSSFTPLVLSATGVWPSSPLPFTGDYSLPSSRKLMGTAVLLNLVLAACSSIILTAKICYTMHSLCSLVQGTCSEDLLSGSLIWSVVRQVCTRSNNYHLKSHSSCTRKPGLSVITFDKNRFVNSSSNVMRKVSINVWRKWKLFSLT